MSLGKLLMSFCQWATHTPFGHGIRNSVWLFPAIEIVHLLALGLLGGTILLVNFRLLGLRFWDEPLRDLAKEVRPWTLGSLGVMLVSGFFLFSSEAVKMYGNVAFRSKMTFLVLAVVYTFTIHRKVAMSREADVAPRWRRLAAVVSLLLWTGVGVSGRLIGYV